MLDAAARKPSSRLRRGRVIAGSLPGRALRLVREWTSMHREELNTNWDLARDRQPLADIEPLP
jgi:hypothetical protein